jgi:Zn-dependent protease
MAYQQPVFTIEPPGTPPPPRRSSGGAGGFVGGLVALLVLVKSFGLTFLSMFFMIFVYAQIFGWKLAAGVVVLIFVHEMGHVIAAKALGMPVTAPLFIPFIGAAIVMKQNPRDAISEAIMAYAGPLAGCVGSWVCLWLAQQMQLPWLAVTAAFSFGLNLFNLIPVPPLDGGRVCAAVSRWFWLLGLLLLGGAVVYFRAWSMLFIAVLILFMAFQRIRDDLRYREAMGSYYRISLPIRALVAAFYLGLIGVLLVGLAEANSVMPQVGANGQIQSDQ